MRLRVGGLVWPRRERSECLVIDLQLAPSRLTLATLPTFCPSESSAVRPQLDFVVTLAFRRWSGRESGREAV